MNHPKKMLALALAMISFAGLAFAQKTEITYMCWYNTTQSEAQSVQAVIDTYNKSQDKIHVTMIAVPRDGYETKVNTMAAGNSFPTAPSFRRPWPSSSPPRASWPTSARCTGPTKPPSSRSCSPTTARRWATARATKFSCSTTTRSSSTPPTSPILPLPPTRPGHGNSSWTSRRSSPRTGTARRRTIRASTRTTSSPMARFQQAVVDVAHRRRTPMAAAS